MKLITAVVTPPEFEAVKKALDIFGITGRVTRDRPRVHRNLST